MLNINTKHSFFQNKLIMFLFYVKTPMFNKRNKAFNNLYLFKMFKENPGCSFHEMAQRLEFYAKKWFMSMTQLSLSCLKDVAYILYRFIIARCCIMQY